MDDPTSDQLQGCIQAMERQIIDDSIKRRIVPLDMLPPEIQEAVIREMFNRK